MISLRCFVVAIALGFAGAAAAQDTPTGATAPVSQYPEPAAGPIVNRPSLTTQTAAERLEQPSLSPTTFDPVAQLRSEIEPLFDPNSPRDITFGILRDKREFIQRNAQRLDSRRLTLLEERLERTHRMRDLEHNKEDVEYHLNQAKGHLAYLETSLPDESFPDRYAAPVDFQPPSPEEAAAWRKADIRRVGADITRFQRESEQASNRLAVAQIHLDSNDEELEIISKQQSYLRDKLNEVENQLFRTLFVDSEAAQYKQLISGFFAALIFIVIAGFFWIAVRHESIAMSIFQNQVGLQFITLFSLVIAIILFGVLGILEGKELSALLGAISGYVLGRASSGQAAQEVADDVKRLFSRSERNGEAGRNPATPPAPPASPAGAGGNV